MSDLPPGPLTVNQFDSVHDSTGRFVASLAGNRALAELLIRAEREADPKPIDAEWLESIGGTTIDNNESVVKVEFEPPRITWFQMYVEWHPFDSTSIPQFYAAQDSVELNAVEAIGVNVPTRGTFRTAMRLLGITIEETKQ